MANTQVEIKGVDKLKRRLDLAGLTALPIRQFMRATGAVLRDSAKDNAPEFSGSLKSSIHVQRIKAKGRLPHSVKIYSSRSYAKYVHGDPKKSGRLKLTEPYTRSVPHYPPIKALKPWSEAKGLNPYAVQRSIGKKGTPLVPFFLIAMKETKAERALLLQSTTKMIEAKWKAGKIRG
ncbi:MAG: hypothetical protein Tp156SUR915002_41 [Prokaryotic dsDNA virus sp.]|jgi:hypothetical protein|nr:MAG: hypothetical protein Tp162SUR384061_50 [Prokaryotic dsDNA virus sp.]QDP59780.1 MAG: hypothetical protein Tp156SUR915002_41 [Prokaryotic dsDNA virus sp.]|tara:strand:- start:7374 stop:7904 length:531 start_codon:yes stop_codon:yes gene_type:complete